MAMFDDPKKELQKLEAQLLKEEEWFENELEAAKALLGDQEAPKTAQQPPKKPVQPARNSMQETQVFRAPGPGPTPTGTPARKLSAAEKVRKNAVTDVNLDEYSEDIYSPKRKKNRFLVILAVLETLGIVGVVAYWLMFLL